MIFVSFSFQESEMIMPQTSENALSVNDKEFLLEYLESSMLILQEQTEDLDATQLQYKTSEERWSISQCLEHIIQTEKVLLQLAEGILAQPSNPERRPEIKISDQQLVEMIEDRSEKFQAPPELQPLGTYTDPGDAMKDLLEHRGKVLALMQNHSEEEMRDHVGDSPIGPIDGYQAVLFIAGHTTRHTAQIAEIKSDPGFPAD